MNWDSPGWPQRRDRGPGKWAVKLGGEGLEARACLKGPTRVSRGRPARSQKDRGVRTFRMAVLEPDNGVSAMEESINVG